MQREDWYVNTFHRRKGQFLRRICGFSDSGTLFAVLCKEVNSSPNDVWSVCVGVGSLENIRQTGGSLVVLAPRGFGGEGLSSEKLQVFRSCPRLWC